MLLRPQGLQLVATTVNPCTFFIVTTIIAYFFGGCNTFPPAFAKMTENFHAGKNPPIWAVCCLLAGAVLYFRVPHRIEVLAGAADDYIRTCIQ